MTARWRHILQHAQPAKQRIDLEGAHEPALDAGGLRQAGDVLTAEQDAPGARPQRAGDQVDEAGLAGAVRSDQRMAGAALEPEVDRIRDRKRAKALAQALRLEPGAHGGGFSCRARRRAKNPSTPPGAKTTISTMNSPIQKYQ
jgi:hypothetical protein